MADPWQQQLRVDEVNLLIPAVLGLAKLLDEFGQCIEQQRPDAQPIDPRKDERLVSALLGLLALRQTVHRWIGSIDAQSAVSPDSNEPTDERQQPGLLR